MKKTKREKTSVGSLEEEMARSTTKDAQDLFHSLRSAYVATPTNLKVHHSHFVLIFVLDH